MSEHGVSVGEWAVVGSDLGPVGSDQPPPFVSFFFSINTILNLNLTNR